MLVEVKQLQEAVVEITLNRPDKRNALSVELLQDFKKALKTHINDSRVLILRGAGKGFCAGLDLHEASEVPLQEHLGTTLRDCLIMLAEAPCITVAAVQGCVLAGGLGVALSCDLCVAEENAFFGLPEARRGLVPSLILPVLQQRVQRTHLHELIFLGETINAERALEIGMVNRVVKTGDLESSMLGLIQNALLSAPGAVTQTKRQLAQKGGKSLVEQIREAYQSHCSMREAKEADEGICSYKEGRPPHWVR